MAEPSFSSAAGMDADDDLPRTLRRERDAQARRAREHELKGAAPEQITQHAAPDNAAPPYRDDNYDYDDLDPAPATVSRLEIPFVHLMVFFLKAVIAAIPALILLVGILWLFGEVLTASFPELVKMQILIRIPN
ncbi:MAG: hypothetical protein ACI9XZ_000318 [Alphaproteobacteria bacterium]|jgi:hypothetical protein